MGFPNRPRTPLQGYKNRSSDKIKIFRSCFGGGRVGDSAQGADTDVKAHNLIARMLSGKNLAIQSNVERDNEEKRRSEKRRKREERELGGST